MMLYTKYQGSRPYGSRQEDFSMFFLIKPICKTCDPQGGAIFSSSGMNKLGRGPLGDASYKISRL